MPPPVTPVTRGTIATANLPGLLTQRISSLRRNLSGYKLAPYMAQTAKVVAASSEAGMWAYRRAQTRRDFGGEIVQVTGDAGSTHTYSLVEHSAGTRFDKRRDPSVINGNADAGRDRKIWQAAAVVLNDIERTLASVFWTPGNWQNVTPLGSGLQTNATDFIKQANLRLDALRRRGVAREEVTMFCSPDNLTWLGANTTFQSYMGTVLPKEGAPNLVAEFLRQRLGIKAIEQMSNGVTNEDRDVANPTLTETWSNDRILFTVVADATTDTEDPHCGRVLYYPQTEGGLVLPDLPEEASIVTVMTEKDEATYEYFTAVAELVVMKSPSSNWVSEMLTGAAA